jgi:perosamine synthetase
MIIPVSRPSIGKEELSAIEQVFQTGWLGLGSVVFDFENKIKEFLPAENVIAVNTGTTALHLALDAYGIGIGDEVIVPSMTFAASIQAITQTGATPVFCEVKESDLNVNIDDIVKKITKKTKAIMPVHYCGKACDMDLLLEIGAQHKIEIIEDAAHAFGSSYKGRKIGSFGEATCFSFDPIKNITCGEGGAIVLHNDELAEKIRRKRILGIDKDTWHRYRNERSWFYEVVEQGYRYHMSNINAAIGLEQFKKLNLFTDRKRKITIDYDEAFSSLKGLKTLKNDYRETVQFCYIVRVLEGKRDAMMEFLRQKGIGSGVHYSPNHLQPFFKLFKTALPVTEKVAEEILTLPLYYDLTNEQVVTIIEAVNEFFAERDRSSC